MVLLGISCRDEKKEVSIVWAGEKATGIQFPVSWIKGIPKDSVRQYVQVRLENDASATAILGEYHISDAILFEPLIPFSRGSGYEIFVKNKRTAQFFVGNADNNDAPKVIATYPQQDTVPENMLKIYIQFSHSMREGQSAKYIKLVKDGKDTLYGVFLDLQPELWNEDRTVLTMWLDPGRIKRDLQPNLKLGAPLKPLAKYQLIVSKEWQDTRGLALAKNSNWLFVTTHRDSLSPDPDQWTIHLPKAASKEFLSIAFNESLDHYLLMECFHVTKNGKTIQGKFEVMDKDRGIRFSPAEPWVAGNYVLTIDSKLEDLAGNNLNRPFDRDVTKTKQPLTKALYSRNFTIQY